MVNWILCAVLPSLLVPDRSSSPRLSSTWGQNFPTPAASSRKTWPGCRGHERLQEIIMAASLHHLTHEAMSIKRHYPLCVIMRSPDRSLSGRLSPPASHLPSYRGPALVRSWIQWAASPANRPSYAPSFSSVFAGSVTYCDDLITPTAYQSHLPDRSAILQTGDDQSKHLSC